jgi:hypothetical protein
VKVTIDNEDFFSPDNELINQVTLQFGVDFFESYSLPITCFSLFASVIYEDEAASFSYDNIEGKFYECTGELNSSFYNAYSRNFYSSESSNTKILEYEITEEPTGLQKLTITNSNGDKAVYYSETLSTNDVKDFGSVKLYPNPAQNEFSAESDLALKQIKVYNQLGHVVAIFEVINSRSSYDISFLTSGTYFIELSSALEKKMLIN